MGWSQAWTISIGCRHGFRASITVASITNGPRIILGYSSAGVEILYMISTSVSTPDEIHAYGIYLPNICIFSIENTYFLFSY